MCGYRSQQLGLEQKLKSMPNISVTKQAKCMLSSENPDQPYHKYVVVLCKLVFILSLHRHLLSYVPFVFINLLEVTFTEAFKEVTTGGRPICHTKIAMCLEILF